jgi:predicted amidophosphoribosyltransferase
MFRYAILSAVSTKQQAAADKTSLQDQIVICRRVNENGWHETAGPYIVPGQSRNKYLNLRDAEKEIPAIYQLLEDARQRKYDVLVIYDHDRLRALLEMVYDSLCDYGVQLFSVSAQNFPVPPDEYDAYENETNDLLIGIGKIKSKSEISRMRRKYRTGMRNRVLIYGLPVQIPFGYRKPLDQVYNRKAIPEPIESITQHIIAIKDLYLQGKSAQACADYLKQNQLSPPKGSVWHDQTVREMLKNPFYAGFVQFEKSKVKKDRRQNSRTRDRHIPQEKIITNRGKHQPLWDEAVWHAIMAEAERRSVGFRGRMNNQFTGLPKCGECDASMWRWKNGPRAVKDRLIWRCSQHLSEHVSITHQELISRVGNVLMRSLQPHLKARETEIVQTKTEQPDEQKKLDDLKQQRARLEEIYLRGTIPLENYERRAQEIDEKMKATQTNEVTAQVKAVQHASLVKEIMATLGKQAAHIPRWLEHNDPSQTNRILHLLLEGIVVHRDKVELRYK